MVQLMTQISRQLSALNIHQAVTKKQNPLLLISVRKVRVDETVGNLDLVVHVVEPVFVFVACYIPSESGEFCFRFSFLFSFFAVTMASVVPAIEPTVAAAGIIIVDPLHELAGI